MEKIIIKHLQGSKAGKTETFPLSNFIELTIGRDPLVSQLQYDPNKDDLVARQQAKIERSKEIPEQFILTDLNSRNGTFVNNKQITGSVNIIPGDKVRFGNNGPEFEFDLDPRPIKATRVDGAPIIPMTRFEGDIPIAPVNSSSPSQVLQNKPQPMQPMQPAQPLAPMPKAISVQVSGGVGKETMMREISQVKSQGRRQILIISSILGLVILLIAGVAGISLFKNVKQSEALEKEKALLEQTNKDFEQKQQQLKSLVSEIDKKQAELAKVSPMSSDVFSKVAQSTVFIEVGWKLILKSTGEQLFHQYVANRYQDSTGQEREYVASGGNSVPAYLQLPDGTIEPLLSIKNTFVPVGFQGTGTGFIVNENGAIITNRHIASSWESDYSLPDRPSPVFKSQNGQFVFLGIIKTPPYWVPSRTKQLGAGNVTGQNNYLEVTLPGTSQRIKANLVYSAPDHDIAAIKIETLKPLPKLELIDNYDSIQPNETINVVGYPGNAPVQYTNIKDISLDPGNAVRSVPQPSSGSGIISRIIKDKTSSGLKVEGDFFNDSYMLSVGTTSPGSSGSPVCNSQGQVIGVFYAGSRDQRITFCVPTRYVKKLIGA